MTTLEIDDAESPHANGKRAQHEVAGIAFDASVRDRTLEYFEEFFKVLDDPERADRLLVRACRS